MNIDCVIFVIVEDIFWVDLDKLVCFLVWVINDVMVCVLEDVWFLFVENIMFGVLVEMFVERIFEGFFFVW